jgi:uncharacterized protein (TIGR02466 family)
MKEIIQYFPTTFYYKENILSNLDKSDIVNYCLDIKQKTKKGGSEWLVNTFNSLGTLDIIKDKNFNNLNKEILKHVNIYNETLGSDHKYEKLSNGWFNIYNKNDYQEFHNHAGYTFSVIYYAQVENNIEDRSATIFKHPYEDMRPLKGVVRLNHLSYQTVKMRPENNSLLIFRSYLQHYVEKNNKNTRITLAYNID